MEYFTKHRLDELENRRVIVEALAKHPDISEGELKLLIDEMDRGITAVQLMDRPARLISEAIVICRDLTK